MSKIKNLPELEVFSTPASEMVLSTETGSRGNATSTGTNMNHSTQMQGFLLPRSFVPDPKIKVQEGPEHSWKNFCIVLAVVSVLVSAAMGRYCWVNIRKKRKENAALERAVLEHKDKIDRWILRWEMQMADREKTGSDELLTDETMLRSAMRFEEILLKYAGQQTRKSGYRSSFSGGTVALSGIVALSGRRGRII